MGTPAALLSHPNSQSELRWLREAYVRGDAPLDQLYVQFKQRLVRGVPPDVCTVRVATYNVHEFLNAARDTSRLDAMARVVQRSNADVVALQEVDALALKRFAVKAGYTHHLVQPTGEVGIANAIISKYPLTGMMNLPLADCRISRYAPRTVLAATVQCSPAAVPLQVYCVHLDVLREAERVCELMQLLTFVRERSHSGAIPHVITGDFNSLTRVDYLAEHWELIRQHREAAGLNLEEPKGTVMQHITNSGYRDVGRAHLRDKQPFPVEVPYWTCAFSTRIDYILMPTHTPGMEYVYNSYQRDPDAASDHNLISAEFTLRLHSGKIPGH